MIIMIYENVISYILKVSPPPPPKKIKINKYPFRADFYLKGKEWLNIGMLYIKPFIMKFSDRCYDGYHEYQIWENLFCNQWC